ncbi:hypothetical protein N9335_03585 [Crocinitomicaceae bacterium]|nr:hypothetical protein [Crocinitomicaceae bacterium]
MRYFLIIILFVIGFQTFGQSLDAHISDSEIRVGDVFELNYVISNSDKFPVTINFGDVFPSELLTSDTIQEKSIPPVEIVSFSDSLVTLNELSQVIRSYNLIVWDSCALSLIGFEYSILDSIVRFPPVYVNVSYYDSKEGVELMDIEERFHNWNKDNKDNKSESDSTWLITVLIIVIVTLLGLFFFILWRKRNNREDNKKSLQESTLEQIKILENEELWRNDLLKEHFVRFSHLLRSYLTSRFGISFLDKTTQQSILLLDSLSIEETLKIKILQLLKNSDLVKFADSNIEDRTILVLFEDLRFIVIQTTPIIEEP